MRVRKARVVMHLNNSCTPIWSKNPDYKRFDLLNTLLLMTFTAKAGVQIYSNATACCTKLPILSQSHLILSHSVFCNKLI